MHKTLLPEGWTRPKGYANGVIAEGGSMIFCGGPDWLEQRRASLSTATFIGQFRQALENVVAVLGSAGAGPEHVTRMTWYVTDRQQYLADLGAGRTHLPGSHGKALSRDVCGRGFSPDRRRGAGRDRSDCGQIVHSLKVRSALSRDIH